MSGRTTVRRIVTVTALWSVAVTNAISGCASHHQASLDERITASVRASAARARRLGLNDQAAVLRDGVVTQAEYDHVWALYRRCLEGLGFEVRDPLVNPMNGRTYILRVGNDPHGVGRQSMACLDHYIGLVDPAVAERPRPIAVPLRRMLRRCLSKAGIQVPATAKDNRDFSRIVGIDRIPTLGGCVNEVTDDSYPDLPYLVWGPPGVL